MVPSFPRGVHCVGVYCVGVSVSCKTALFNGMSHSDLNAYLLSHPVPAVVGLGGFHIYDHHHLCAALHASTVDDDHRCGSRWQPVAASFP